MKEKKISKWIQGKIGLRHAYTNNDYVMQSFCRFFAKTNNAHEAEGKTKLHALFVAGP